MNAKEINRLLPQIQCEACGYRGCLSYAQALAQGKEKSINLCRPGGTEVMRDLAHLLQLPPASVEIRPLHTIYIDEEMCIGCTACIRVCPVDAIVGSRKKMHTVIRKECTGCQLCLPVCPVDCMYLETETHDYLPLARFLSHANTPREQASEHALIRYKNRNARLKRLEEQKKEQQQQKATQSSAIQLLLKAKKLAAKRKSRRVSIESELLQNEKIVSQQKRSAYRKAQRDLRYGDHLEELKAQIFLKECSDQQKTDR